MDVYMTEDAARKELLSRNVLGGEFDSILLVLFIRICNHRCHSMLTCLFSKASQTAATFK